MEGIIKNQNQSSPKVPYSMAGPHSVQKYITPQEVDKESDIEILEEDKPEVYYVTENINIAKQKGSTRKTKKPRILKKPPTVDYRFIERFASAWRCKICQKISSNKFLALDHREEEHRVAMTLK